MARSALTTGLTRTFRGIATAFKSAVAVTTVPGYAVNTGRGWWGTLREGSWSGFQRGITVDTTEGILAFSAVYSCISLIAKDVSKLRAKLVELKGGIWLEVANPAFSPVLRKPNHYQTRIQFLSAWIVSKLIHGNTYVLKERDQRKVVIGLHVLNAAMVKPLVAENGEVFYSLSRDKLALTDSVVVPASEIIHDRGECLFHPLVGIPPIYACAISATQGNRIQTNGAKFFENMSRPSGMLSAPGTIDDVTAGRMKEEFEANFSGANIGRLFVGGDDLKYYPMTIPAQQAQLIEQLNWTVADVARCFHIPLHKIAAGQDVKYANMGEMNQGYYSQTLQDLIECVELLLDEGLGLTGGPQTLGVELDLEGLLRMDPAQRAKRNETLVKAGIMAVNEARATDNLPPVTGGDMPFVQVQNVPIDMLRELGGAPVPAPTPAPAAAPSVPAADGAAKAADLIQQASVQLRSQAEAVETAEADRLARADAAATAQLQVLKDLAEEIRAEREELRVEKQRVADEEAAREFVNTITKGLEHV